MAPKNGKAVAESRLEALDIEAALSEYPTTPEKSKALAGVLTKPVALDLSLASDEELVETDVVQISRVIYVASLLRVLQTLRSDAVNPLDQAKVALAYVRHAETNSLAWLQFGRSAADTTLLKSVQELRQQLAAVSEVKAKRLAASYKDTDAPSTPKSEAN